MGVVVPSAAGWLGPDGGEQAGRGERAGELGEEVGGGLGAGEVAGQGEGQGHRRVQVRAGEVAGRVDHRHHDQAEDEGDADDPERARVLGLGDDRPAAGEDEGEDADSLGGGAAEEVGALVHGRSAAGGGRGEDVADRVERAGDEGEVAAVAATLALDQAGLDRAPSGGG